MEFEVYFIVLAVLGAACVLIVFGLALLMLVCVIVDRITDIRNNGHINATIFGLGLHIFTLNRERNRRFVKNAKLAGYSIWEWRGIAVGLDAPKFIRKVIKAWGTKP